MAGPLRISKTENEMEYDGGFPDAEGMPGRQKYCHMESVFHGEVMRHCYDV